MTDTVTVRKQFFIFTPTQTIFQLTPIQTIFYFIFLQLHGHVKHIIVRSYDVFFHAVYA